MTFNKSDIADIFLTADDMNIVMLKHKSILKGIPLSISNDNGNNLIHYVINLNNSKISDYQRMVFIKKLVSENVNPEQPNQNNMTPLHLACKKNMVETAKYLISIGVNMNYKDNSGCIPLDYAITGEFKKHRIFTPKSLITIPKKKSKVNIKQIYDNRNEIWTNINNSNFIKSILNTMIEMTQYDDTAKAIIIEYQKDLNKLQLSTDNPDDKTFSELEATYYLKFVKHLLSKWGNFNENVISLHQTDLNSYPENDPSGFSFIKNSNVQLQLKKNIQKNIDECLSLLQTVTVNDININNINNNIITSLLTQNIASGNIVGNNYDNTNIPTLTLDDVDEVNNFFHSNSFDEADNIIDLDTMIFAGGSRLIDIQKMLFADFKVLYQAFDNLYQAFDNYTDINILKSFIRSLYDDYNINKSDYDINTNAYDEDIINRLLQLIEDIILEKENIQVKIQSIITQIDDYINKNNIPDNYYRIIKILERFPYTKNYKTQVLWLYTLFNNIRGIENNNNRKFKMNEHCLILISALLNNGNNNIKDSIKMSMKYIFLREGGLNKYQVMGQSIENVFTKWIVFLLRNDNSDDDNFDYSNNSIVLNDPDPEIRSIMVLSMRFFTNNDRLSGIDLDWLNVDINKYSMCELLGLAIVKYYLSLDVKPLLSNIVDTLSLIRFYEINKNRSPTLTNDELLKRLIKININSRFIKNNKVERYFRKIFPNNSEILENIIQYQVPSKLYYTIQLNNIDDPNIINEMKKKYYEASILGLNFIGLIPHIEQDDQFTINGVNIDTSDYYLYNYTNSNSANIFNNYDIYIYIDKKYQYRPPTIYSYLNLLITMTNTINEYEELVFDKIKGILEKLKEGKSKLYSKGFSYLYPLINSLESIDNFFTDNFDKISDNQELISLITERTMDRIKQQYSNKFNIYRFTQYINNINADLFIMHYIHFKGSRMRIPQFLYNQLGDKPIISYHNNEIKLDIDNVKKIKLRKINKSKDGSYSYIPMADYNNIISNFVQNRFFINKNISSQYFVMKKKNELPPSLEVGFKNFYKYNLIELIKSTNINLDNIELDGIELLDNTQKNIKKKLYIATEIQTLLKENLESETYKIGHNIFNNMIKETKTKFTRRELKQIFGKIEFKVSNTNVDEDDINELLKLPTNIDKFTQLPINDKVHVMDKMFIIYDDDQSNLTINKQELYGYETNEDLIKELLENGSNYYNYNNSNESSILNIMKMYNFKNIELLKKYVDFRSFDVEEHPFQYMINTFNLHLENTFKNGMSTQATEVLYMFSSDELKNNIIYNIKNSFVVCFYITNHYLSNIYSSKLNKNYFNDTFINGADVTGYNIITSYNNIKNSQSDCFNYMEQWNKLIKDKTIPTSKDINIWTDLTELKNLNIDSPTSLLNNVSEFNKKLKGYEFVHNDIKQYFEGEQYLSNRHHQFAFDLLKHLTICIICHHIKLFTIKIINEYMTATSISIDTTLLDTIITDNSLDKLATDLIKHSLNIYDDEDEKDDRITKTVGEILIDFYTLMKNDSKVIIITDELLTVIKNNVINYYDTVLPTILNNWLVVIENQFKYYINQYRIMKTLEILFF